MIIKNKKKEFNFISFFSNAIILFLIISYFLPAINECFADEKSFTVNYERKREIVDSLESVFSSSRVILSEKPRKRGTGFIVSDKGWLITAAHVVDELNIDKPYSKDNPPVLTYGPSGEKEVIVQKFNIKSEIDISLCKLKSLEGKMVPAKLTKSTTSDNFWLGREVGIIGSTLAKKTFSSTQTIIVPMPVIKKGIISNVEPMDLSYFWIDANLIPGDSGGPVFDLESGEVLGISSQIVIKPLQTNAFRKFNFSNQEESLKSFNEIVNIFKTIPSEYINTVPNKPFTLMLTTRASRTDYAKIVPAFFIKVLLASQGLFKMDIISN
jgi:S1-C subfamily serine protease